MLLSSMCCHRWGVLSRGVRVGYRIVSVCGSLAFSWNRSNRAPKLTKSDLSFRLGCEHLLDGIDVHALIELLFDGIGIAANP